MTHRQTFRCIDAHTCGNPVRVVTSGAPPLEGPDMMSKRQHFLQAYDWIRLGLMFEPRGHDMMSGSILYPPHDPRNDVAVLFIETSGCLPMCGHGTIGTVTVAVEKGLVKPRQPGLLRLEVPAGVVEVSYRQEGGRVKSVKFTNVPSFVAVEGLEIESPHLGRLSVSVSYGGNFYAIIEQQENFRDMADFSAGELIAMSGPIRQAVNRAMKFVHPENPGIAGCSHVMWTGKPRQPGSDARNAVFYGDKAIDRSPCGTGTSARMALQAARGELKTGDSFVHESIIGSQFTGRVEAITRVGNKAAIVPSIEGWARIFGENTITIDEEDDPFALGFQVR